MKICRRCASKAASHVVLGLDVCGPCATSLAWKYGDRARVAGVGDALLELNPAYDLGKAVADGNPLEANPAYALGKNLGQAASKSDLFGGLPNMGKAVADTAKTVKIVAVAGAVIGVAAIGFVMWNAHRTQKAALGFVSAHPEVLAL